MENQSLELSDGSKIVLKKPAVGDSPRNVFRVASDGKVLWQIAPNLGEYKQSYVEIYFRESMLIAYNFDSCEYEVDLETGNIKMHEFLH
jgi:hypothetical protein